MVTNPHVSDRAKALLISLACCLLLLTACQPGSDPQAVLQRLEQAMQQAPMDDGLLLVQQALDLTRVAGPYAPPVLTSWIKALEQTVIHGADPAIVELIVQYIHALVTHGTNPAALRVWLISAESRPYLERLQPHLQDLLFSIVPSSPSRVQPS